MSWKESLSCWREVKGRTEKEPTYYLMPETGETTFVKPRELMRKEELEQYDKFLIAKEAAEKSAGFFEMTTASDSQLACIGGQCRLACQLAKRICQIKR